MQRVKNSVFRIVYLSSVAAAVVMLSILATGIFTVVKAEEKVPAALTEEELKSIDNLSSAFERIANVVRPSVVSIKAVKKLKVQSRGSRQRKPFNNSPFRDFFGEEFYNRFRDHQFKGPGGWLPQEGQGSGVIVDAKGYILTNNHVVGGADEVKVVLDTGEELEAKVVGTDSKTDLAVIKVDGNGHKLQPATLGDSDKLRVGKWVVAVGSPFGLDQTITAGIVSAKGRTVGIAHYEDFIQTDAAINPGNSGGPLVNLRGEVVGINTAIYSRSGGYMGIGFAIPVNMAKSIMQSLIKDGKVVRGWLGVMIQELDDGLASSFGYDSTDGALVGDVTDDGPAKKAGIQQGDIIVRFDGIAIKDPDQLKNQVAKTQPEKNVKVRVFRDGSFKVVKVTLTQLEDKFLGEERDEQSSEDLGLTVETLTRELSRRFGLEYVDGVVITQLQRGGLAHRSGLVRGDIVVSVGGAVTASAEQFYRALDKSDLKEGVRLAVRRGKGQFFIIVKAEE